MKNEKRRHRLTLTLLMVAAIFVLQLIAIVVAAVTVYILVQTGIIAELGQSKITPLRLILFMTAISTALGVLITTLSSRVYLKPVNRMIDQMNRLASGDYKARLTFGKPISAHPAFMEISESFNKMAEELEGTEMLRSDFINNFSHEFKTPIVSIAGFAKVLKRGNLTPEQQQEYLDVIEEESMRLSAMATNVLNMTKVENQTILTDVTQFNLSEQMRSAILLLESKWSKKNLDLNLRMGEYRISGNEELLKHVWINLLDNAIKFSEDYGCIDVCIEENNASLVVSISNGGKTIPSESLDRIFNKFYQADESHSTPGNGIGLAIVKRVVELHKGTVSVQSGRDLTTFTVTLPKKQTVTS